MNPLNLHRRYKLSTLYSLQFEAPVLKIHSKPKPYSINSLQFKAKLATFLINTNQLTIYQHAPITSEPK